MPAARQRLGDILIDAKLITPDQLKTALEINKATGTPTGEVLVGLGFVTDEAIKRALSQQIKVPFVTLQEMGIDTQAAKLMPEQMAKRYRAVPLRKNGTRLVVAMADPLNVFAIDDIQFTTGLEVDVVVMTERDIDKAMNQAFQIQKIQAQVAQQAQEQQSSADLERQRAAQQSDDAPIVKLVNSIIEGALKECASDIHLEPRESALRVRYRIDGALYDIMSTPAAGSPAVISRLKIMAGMDIAERRIPQDGRIQTRQGDDEIDLRVSSLPTIHGEKVVIRVLRKSSINLGLHELGMDQQTLELYRRMIRSPHGMLLVTGPTGSGKTTTLYSTLTAMNNPSKNVVTIEDPVEYRVEGINQVNVNPKAGLTFASGLRSILRQDPNTIMVGEIRDAETADVAIRAAMTGHLVLSTLHTNDAPSTVARLVDMGIEPYLVASALIGVVAQRLVRRICPDCSYEVPLAVGAPERLTLGLTEDEPVVLRSGKGCNACNGSGYRGRVGVFEVMPFDADLRRLTLARASGDELRRQAIQSGMRSLRQDAISRCLCGLTTVEEVTHIAYDER
ncbi:MAG: GspE/PulE family protein [Bacillota bacterium]